MTSRSTGAAKNRNRLDLISQAPPSFTRADAAEIIACCITPRLTTPGTLTVDANNNEATGEDATRSANPQKSREEALVRLLTAALNEFLVDRALESDPSQADIVARFRLISDAAHRLQRVLGMQGDHTPPSLPWSLERGFLHPMMRASRASITRAGRAEPKKYDSAQPYLALLAQCKADLNQALAGVNFVAQWAAAASRLEKFQGIRATRPRDDVLDRFIITLGHIWTGVLGQDLEVVTNSTRNNGRWAPIPDSLNQFIVFVGKCAKPLGMQLPREDLMARAARLLRRQAAAPGRKLG
jgi:hypothetical protein